jgi:phosphoglycolate phosphatase-like HAD superfamily hydrolase
MALAPDHYDKGIADYLRYYKSLHHHCPAPFEGIKELLLQLQNKGVHIAMVTGKGKHSTDISLQHFELTHFFEIIETGSPSGPRKDEGIQLIIDNWSDIKKNEIIYVGDAPGDIIASRKVGVPVIAAAWAETAELERLKALQPDKIFYTINEFSNWLKEKI